MKWTMDEKGCAGIMVLIGLAIVLWGMAFPDCVPASVDHLPTFGDGE